MAYTQADHTYFWEMTHHPVVTLVVAIVLAAVVLSLLANGTAIGPTGIEGLEFVP